MSGVVGGQTYYVKVNGTSSPSNDGVYALTLNLGTGVMPVVPLPNTELLNGNPFVSTVGAEVTADGPGYDVFRANEQPPTTATPAVASANLTMVQQAALTAPQSSMHRPWPLLRTHCKATTPTSTPRQRMRRRLLRQSRP